MTMLYKYYCIMRPPAPGTIPRGAIEIRMYNERRYIPEIERMAWGYAVYTRELTYDEIYEHELIAAPTD